LDQIKAVNVFELFHPKHTRQLQSEIKEKELKDGPQIK
jgi:hypothetical protein